MAQSRGGHDGIKFRDFSSQELDKLRGAADTTEYGRDVVKKEAFNVEEEKRLHLGTDEWWHAAFHIVTAVIGTGILGLANAVSWLGWAGGMMTLAIAAGISIYTTYLLSALHEAPNGTRYFRYKDLAYAVFGQRGVWGIAPIQCVAMYFTCIAYTVTAGTALKSATDNACNCQCSTALWHFVLAFSLLQVALSQIPNMHGLRWVSFLGAAMSAIYAFIVFVASLKHIADNGAVGGANATGNPGTGPVDKVFNVFNALADIMFAYSFHAILLEITGTMKTPPKPVVSVMKGTAIGLGGAVVSYYAVAIVGYLAFGNGVAGNILISLNEGGSTGQWAIDLAQILVVIHVAGAYQIFAQPLFEYMESYLFALYPRLAKSAPLGVRLLWRTLFVATTCFIALLIPFFSAINGIVGSISFLPMSILYPCLMWIKVKKPRGLQLLLLYCIMGIGTVVCTLGLLGSLRSVVVNSATYHAFSATGKRQGCSSLPGG